jgi:ATP-dependent protease ClpP protease subunit
MNPAEAVDYGIIDGIVAPRRGLTGAALVGADA